MLPILQSDALMFDRSAACHLPMLQVLKHSYSIHLLLLLYGMACVYTTVTASNVYSKSEVPSVVCRVYGKFVMDTATGIHTASGSTVPCGALSKECPGELLTVDFPDLVQLLFGPPNMVLCDQSIKCS